MVIHSPLYGKELEAHYAPLFAHYGCQPLSCNIVGAVSGLVEQTRCRCTGAGTIGTVTTDPKSEAYTLAVALAKPGPTP